MKVAAVRVRPYFFWKFFVDLKVKKSKNLERAVKVWKTVIN